VRVLACVNSHESTVIVVVVVMVMVAGETTTVCQRNNSSQFHATKQQQSVSRNNAPCLPREPDETVRPRKTLAHKTRRCNPH
jgi:hypothetical protein